MENPDWLIRIRDLPCVLTHNPEGNDPAHIRYGLSGGMARKPDDDLALPLRHDLHDAQHNHRGGEVGFWIEHISMNPEFLMECLKAYARQLYKENNP